MKDIGLLAASRFPGALARLFSEKPRGSLLFSQGPAPEPPQAALLGSLLTTK